ncbi:hypothetical protein, partial [Acinetobacter baumannii]|uniref:hypothetical protein n=1 Tax=Acinetobacter baumannii TaxID=470 RepID=UPI003AF49FB7
VTIAFLVSWVAAVLFVPYLGEKLLPYFTKTGHQAPWYVRLWARITKKPQPQTVAISQDHHYDPYQSSIYLRVRKMVEFCVTYRK